MRLRLLISISAFALLMKLQAATAASTEIPIEYSEGLIWIKATVAKGSEPLNLLLDTGAGASALNTTAAERLGLKPGRRICARGVETTLTGYSVKPVALTSAGFEIPGPSMAVNLQKLSDSCSRPIDGLLGADFFRGRIVQIDFDACKLRILRDTVPLHSEGKMPLQFRPCGIRVLISVNHGKPEWVRLDTGCASALQWVTTKVRAEDCDRKPAIGLSEVSIPQTETTVQLGSSQFENVPTGLHKSPIFQGESGLLGNGLLCRFARITIDARAGSLVLESRRSEQ